MACAHCNHNSQSLSAIISDNDQSFQFALEHKLLKDTEECPKCHSIVQMDRKQHIFRCRRTISTRNRVYKVRCNFKKYGLKNTWFHNSKLSYGQILKITYLWCCSVPLKLSLHESGLSLKSIDLWYSHCREVAIHYCETQSEKLGGVGSTVQIEAKYCKRKYEKQRVILGQWVLGGFENSTKKTFLLPIDRPDEEVLLKIIKFKVEPGTTIVTSEWSLYKNLSDHGYVHETVNHTRSFLNPRRSVNYLLSAVDMANPEKKAKSPTVKRRCEEEKNVEPWEGRVPKHYMGHLAEHLFKKSQPNFGARFHEFLLCIASLYTPECDTS